MSEAPSRKLPARLGGAQVLEDDQVQVVTDLDELSHATFLVEAVVEHHGSKAAVLASMTDYADGDTAVGRSALRLEAGLWMWSGAYFAGLAHE